MSNASSSRSAKAVPSFSKDTEERLLDLLDTWQDAADQGRELSSRELCQDCPELAEEVQRRIDVLRKMGKLAKLTMIASPGDSSPTSHDLANLPTNMEASNSRSLQHLLKIFAPPKAPEELGRLGDYAILGLLGEGGMGAVFVAEDLTLNRRIALKVMRPEIAANPKARDRFLREAKSVAKLQNDHVVPIFYVGKEGGVLFITMPLLQGETLDQRLRRGPALTMADIMKVGRQAAEGLAAAHELNLIHRDIKPANLWLEYKHSDFRVKILDFGLAKLTAATDNVTGSGSFLGTPGFMSPEQIDSLTLDGRTDLFSLGCVLYRLATGKQPFNAATLTALLRATAEHVPASPHQLNAGIPLAFSQLIMRLLQKKPETRYASARDLVSAFDVLSLLFPH
jgi:serine/threonine protein kinase